MFQIIFKAHKEIPVLQVKQYDILELKIQTQYFDGKKIFIPKEFFNLRTKKNVNFDMNLFKVQHLENFINQKQVLQLTDISKLFQFRQIKYNLPGIRDNENYLFDFNKKKIPQKLIQKLKFSKKQELNLHQQKQQKCQYKFRIYNLNNFYELFKNFGLKVESIQEKEIQMFDLLKNEFIIKRKLKIRKNNQFKQFVIIMKFLNSLLLMIIIMEELSIYQASKQIKKASTQPEQNLNTTIVQQNSTNKLKQRNLRRSRRSRRRSRRNRRKNRRKQKNLPFNYQIKQQFQEQTFNYREIRNPVLRQKRPNENECDLQMELYEMYYTPAIRTIWFRIGFASNCMAKKDINFEVYFDESKTVNWNFHPNKVILELFSNKFEIQYSSPIVRDKFDVLRSLQYTVGKLLPTKPNLEIDLQSRNETYIFPQKDNTFTPYNMMKIQEKNLIVCEGREKTRRNLKMSDYVFEPPLQQAKQVQTGEDVKSVNQINQEKEQKTVLTIQKKKEQQFKEEKNISDIEIFCKIE